VPAYTTFLFSGLVSWLMLQQTIIIGTASIVNNQHLIRKVYVPKMAFPLSNVLARYVDHLALIAILIIYLILFQYSISPAFAFLAVSVSLHFLFSFGAVLLLSVIYIKIRDIQQIAAIIFQALFYASPVIYPADALPERIHFLLKLNPFYYFIQIFRYPIYSRAIPPFADLAPACVITVITLAAGLWLFSSKEKEIVFHLS
jgi:ABC-type polysaccharide/polyol phosphate export permease